MSKQKCRYSCISTSRGIRQFLRTRISSRRNIPTASRWPVEKSIDAGYGLATVHYFDFFPDSKDRYAESILALFGHPSEGDIPADGGQAIAAWAWGYSRVMDYLETDWQVDASKIILMGQPPFGLALPIRVLQSSSPTNPDVAEQPYPDGRWVKLSTGSTTLSLTGSAKTSAGITRKKVNCRSTSMSYWLSSLHADHEPCRLPQSYRCA